MLVGAPEYSYQRTTNGADAKRSCCTASLPLTMLRLTFSDSTCTPDKISRPVSGSPNASPLCRRDTFNGGQRHPLAFQRFGAFLHDLCECLHDFSPTSDCSIYPL